MAQMGKRPMKNTNWQWTKESALEVAKDAIARRARLLQSQDPEVSEALRRLTENMGDHSFYPPWIKKGAGR